MNGLSGAAFAWRWGGSLDGARIDWESLRRSTRWKALIYLVNFSAGEAVRAQAGVCWGRCHASCLFCWGCLSQAQHESSCWQQVTSYGEIYRKFIKVDFLFIRTFETKRYKCFDDVFFKKFSLYSLKVCFMSKRRDIFVEARLLLIFYIF